MSLCGELAGDYSGHFGLELEVVVQIAMAEFLPIHSNVDPECTPSQPTQGHRLLGIEGDLTGVESRMQFNDNLVNISVQSRLPRGRLDEQSPPIIVSALYIQNLCDVADLQLVVYSFLYVFEPFCNLMGVSFEQKLLELLIAHHFLLLEGLPTERASLHLSVNCRRLIDTWGAEHVATFPKLDRLAEDRQADRAAVIFPHFTKFIH